MKAGDRSLYNADVSGSDEGVIASFGKHKRSVNKVPFQTLARIFTKICQHLPQENRSAAQQAHYCGWYTLTCNPRHTFWTSGTSTPGQRVSETKATASSTSDSTISVINGTSPSRFNWKLPSAGACSCTVSNSSLVCSAALSDAI
jgi:hypothetical protein